MKKLFFGLSVFVLLAISTTSFAFSNKALSPFDEIILSGNVSALLVAGDEENIAIKNDEERLDFYVEGRTLKVKAKDLVQYNKTPTIKVIITYKKLRAIKARAGASAYSQDAIKGDGLELRFSSGATGEIEVQQNSLEVGVSEGGQLELAGITGWQEVKVATGGTLSAYKLDADNTIVKANTGGNAKVVALESIDARANTGGSITYKGNPKKIQKKDGLSGTVRSW